MPFPCPEHKMPPFYVPVPPPSEGTRGPTVVAELSLECTQPVAHAALITPPIELAPEHNTFGGAHPFTVIQIFNTPQ